MTIWVPLKEQRNFNKELLDTALLIIAGGSNSGNDFTGDSTDAEATRILAQTTGSVAVLLNQVPNGRITVDQETDAKKSCYKEIMYVKGCVSKIQQRH